MSITWNYREGVHETGVNLAGFDVEATDGSIGKIDEDTLDRDHIVIDTGFWIFGKKRLVPANVIKQIDYDDEKVFVDLTKDQIKEAPDFDPDTDRSASDWDRDTYTDYYRTYFGPGTYG